METVTPEKAKAWLARSRNPRPIKPRGVRQFVDHLNNRTFELTHQGIALDEEGYQVDGQHRLTAIVETGQTVDMFVTRGINARGIIMVDRGSRRDNSVVLRCDPRVAQVITLATKTATAMGVPSEVDLLKFKRVLEDDTVLLIEHYAKAQRRLTSAPVKLGAVLNMKSEPDWVCAQWSAFNRGDFPAQSTSIQSLYRRLMGERIITTAQVLVYSFKAFAKGNKELNVLTVKNVGANIEEIRKVLRVMAGMKAWTDGR